MALAYRGDWEGGVSDGCKEFGRLFSSHLPADQVPYWDFRSEAKDRSVLDSSASACAASGLLEICSLMEDCVERIPIMKRH